MAALPARADKHTATPDKTPQNHQPAADSPELAGPDLAAQTASLLADTSAAAPPPAPPPASTILRMQRAYGNQATRQLLAQQKRAAPDAQREIAPVPTLVSRTRPNPFQSPVPQPDESAETEGASPDSVAGPTMGAASGGAPGTPSIQRGILDDAREALGGLDPTAVISQVRSLLSGGESSADQEQSSAETEAESMGRQTETTATQGEQAVTQTEQEAQQDQGQAEQETQHTESEGQAGESQVGEAGDQGAQQIEAMGATTEQTLSLETQLAGQNAGQVGEQAAQAAQQAGGGAAQGAAAGASQAQAAATGGVRQEMADGISCPEADVLTRASGLGRDALNMLIRGADAVTGGMASRLAGLAQKVGHGLARGAQIVGQAVDQIATSIKTRVRQMAAPLINAVNAGIARVETIYNNVRTKVTAAVTRVTDAVRNGVSWLVNQGPQWLAGKISSIQSAIGGAVQRAASMIGGAVASLIRRLPGGEAILSGIDRLRNKITSVVGSIRTAVGNIVERGRALGERVISGARSLADRALQTVVQGARNARDLARSVVQGIGNAATRIYETVVPAPVRRLADQARQFIGQQVGKVRAAAGDVMKQVEGAVCVPLNEIAEPCINQYLPFSEGQSETTPNSTTSRGGTSSSITLSSSSSVTIPLAEFGVPGSAEVGRGASVSISRSGARAYSVAVSGESTVFYKLEEGEAGAASLTVDSPAGNGDAARTDAIWQALTGSGGAAPAAGGGSNTVQTPGDKIGLKAGVKRNLTVNYGFNVANSTCDLASLAGLLGTYGLSGAVSAIVPQPFSSIVSAAGSAVAAGGWSDHITGVSLTNTNMAEVNGKVTPGQGQISGSLGAESSTSVGLSRQDDGSFRPEASFSQALNAQVAGEMNLGGLFNVGGSLGAQGSQSLTLIYDRASGLISPSSMTTSLSATLGLQGFNIQSIPTQFLPADASGIVTQNLEAFRRAGVRGSITAQLQLTASNIQALTAHVANYLSTAPIEQVTWEGVMRKVREGMQQVAFDRQLTVTLTEIARAGVSGEAEVNAEGTTIGVAASVSAERRIVHTLYSSTSRMSGPTLNPEPAPVIPPPTPTPTPDHPEPVHPVPDHPTPGPGPGPGPGPHPTPPPSRKNPLDMSADELEADVEAQHELFDMAHETRTRQQAFGQSMIAQSRSEGTANSILKRDDFDAFIAGVLEKVRRKGYARVGEMPDIVRGRFNMARLNDVNQVVGAITNQTQFRVIEVVPPREREGVPLGYPRWHIVVEDSNRIIHEWQIGTQAVTDVYEERGINIPTEVLPLPEGMHNDIHDIEYDILKRIQEDHPDIAAGVGIPEFRRQVALASADAGRLGADMPDKNERIVELHNQCSTILRLLVDRHGPNIIRKYFKSGSSGGPEEAQ